MHGNVLANGVDQVGQLPAVVAAEVLDDVATRVGLPKLGEQGSDGACVIEEGGEEHSGGLVRAALVATDERCDLVVGHTNPQQPVKVHQPLRGSWRRQQGPEAGQEVPFRSWES